MPLMNWLRNYLKRQFGLYDISDLHIGAHCGCCGRWMPDEIAPKDWPVSICKDCQGAEL